MAIRQNQSIMCKAWAYIKLVQHVKFVKSYVGKSMSTETTRFSGGYGPKFDGNSILLQVSESRFMFIGETVFEFDMLDSLQKYYSVVGNNDVPYPIILGDKYVYNVIEKQYVDRQLFPAGMKDADWADASGYFYGHKGERALEKDAKKFAKVKVIQKRLY